MSRFRRELNSVFRRLDRGEVDAYLLTYRGRKICYVLTHERLEEWCNLLKEAIAQFGRMKAESDRAGSAGEAGQRGMTDE